MTKFFIDQISEDIRVVNEGLVQGLITVGPRNFWYECDMGAMELAELDGNPNDFNYIAATCLCEAIGKQHKWPREEGDEFNACDGIWTTDKNTHVLLAGLCLTILLNKND